MLEMKRREEKEWRGDRRREGGRMVAYEGGWAVDSLREVLSHDLVVAREKSRIRPESERRLEYRFGKRERERERRGRMRSERESERRASPKRETEPGIARFFSGGFKFLGLS